MVSISSFGWLSNIDRIEGAASFTKAYQVSTTITGGGSLILSALASPIGRLPLAKSTDTPTSDYEKIASLGLAISPNFEISTTTGTATSATIICPTNKDTGTNDTITWGLQYYQYSYEVQGTKGYGGWDPMMRNCDADQIAHKQGGTFPYDMTFPAKQTGAQDDASAEVEFQCCTDTMSDSFLGSPVCPAAT